MNENEIVPAAPTAESAPATNEQPDVAANQPDAGATPPKEDAPKPAPHSRLQKRIDELTAQRYEEQRRAEAAEAKYAAVERQHALRQQFSQIQANAPDIEKFQNLHQYQMAMADWNAQRTALVTTAQWEQRMQEMQASQAKSSQEAMAQQRQVMQENVAIEAKMAAGAKKYPDFQQVVMNPDLPAIRENPALLRAVLEADNGPDIAYYAAKNPAEYERLLLIRDPIQVAREVFKLDAKFSGAGATTNAPPPPPQRTGTATASKDWGQMSTAEHVKAYAERNRNR